MADKYTLDYTGEEINKLLVKIDNLPEDVSTLKFEIVSELPTEDINTSTIYLIKTKSNDYEEYIYINNEWEMLGTTKIDLTPYATKEYVNGEVSTINTTLNKKVEKYNYTATIPVTGWSASAPYTVSVAVTGLLATDTPDISVNQSTTMATAQAQLEAWNCINKIETSANAITCTCYNNTPVTAIPIAIKGVR